ncbi:CpaD family pilus assembly protein [Bradyrhizobium sp. U87765 SZCCT0131]|uniref:CpaD family pilus assembly protein n=1 Tax=unclassified Bradyrhizobium TaxID=2631580 RepID=UPI001BA4ACFE|nr:MULTISPECIES: CpaD family pilus assembly protein [unclassified Bradyrhizobium]MBR1222107.1 CpaD family pilus assembly protein [Bradyrhizobium sp. U87765 SZCCT0131]MBR1263695.1 CpaD family pilus assembly protein [Bradyrhizobium sp. U87765 SZCCT0134]MBR1302735.1 CpaD family pilus assembly protein [Bradyrhizobium sp. U87765 SZCCT0110]MBR1319945.1 CpaD family pilus assembly protein [Bradyrhizobium sp. U87765 SZCCT0109]MBR1348942.1 CpaD family pilus assembly protein [Bradyrhizobium sp. U87765 SZ
MTNHTHPVTSPRRWRAALLLIGVSMSLGGCLTHTRDPDNALASIPTDYRQRHPIVIEEANRTVEVFVGSGRGGLTATQRADVISLGQAWLREGTGTLLIDLPKDTPNARAASESYREIRSLLSAIGIPARAVSVRDYTPRDPRQFATVRLSYPRIAAEAGPCGLWPDDLGPSIKNKVYVENKPYHNFGCSTQRNLAAMVENPSDLVQPRPETPPYTARRSIAFEKYRKGNPTATNYSDSDKAKLSDLGK